MNTLNRIFLAVTAVSLAACGDSGGGGSTTDAGAGGAADLGPGGSGGSVPGGAGGSGGTVGGNGGDPGGTGGTAGSGGTGGAAGAGGADLDVGVTEDVGVGDTGVAGDGPAVDPDGGTDVICQPCLSDDDCGGGVCIELGAPGEAFCTITCAEAADCGDGNACTPFGEGDDVPLYCTLEGGGCPAIESCVDADGDGYGDGLTCLGPDCDDASELVNPGMADDCDGQNNDCDAATDEGFAAQTCGQGACASQSACVGGGVVPCAPGNPVGDDNNCNGQDEDCDSVADESYVATECGEGVCAAESACADGVEVACAPGDPRDADDTNCDNVDDDCNGEADEDFVGTACGVGACAVTGHCEQGQEVCEENPQLAPDDARCDGVDEDCDGPVDEDWVPVQTCGLGVCRRDGICDAAAGGEVCTAGTPPSAIDDTCDGLDDDCDGPIDEECGDNNFRFEIVNLDADSLDVAVIYHQTVSPLADIADTQPRVLNLWFTHSASLAVVPDNEDTDEDESATEGSALIAASKTLTFQERGNRVLRIAALSAVNTNRIAPEADTGDAEIAIIHFTLEGAAPHLLEWIENDPDNMITGTTLAPVEAMNILSMSDASFGN